MNNIKKTIFSISNLCIQSRPSLLKISPYNTLLNIQNANNKTTLNSNQSDTLNSENDRLAGLKNTFEMFDKVSKREETSNEEKANKPIDNRSFAAMVRESSLIGIGDPNGRLITGKIFEIVDEDLYIDFGGKFHCVCKRPKTKARY